MLLTADTCWRLLWPFLTSGFLVPESLMLAADTCWRLLWPFLSSGFLALLGHWLQCKKLVQVQKNMPRGQCVKPLAEHKPQQQHVQPPQQQHVQYLCAFSFSFSLLMCGSQARVRARARYLCFSFSFFVSFFADVWSESKGETAIAGHSLARVPCLSDRRILT
jgi:hypothetical protein